MSDAGASTRYIFVRRPVTAIVVSVVITLLGAVSLFRLPINQYPQITPPQVQVTAFYPGATAADVAEAVSAPIEEQLSGLDGLLYYQSSNAGDGSMLLNATFDISRSQDLAAVDVQNAVNVALPQLPEAVRQNGVVITKSQSGILLVVALSSRDQRYDVGYLSNYAKLYIEDELKRINGVGDARVYGNFDFSMLLSLDPDRMAQLGLTVQDVQSAVLEQNATKPAGRIGREPAPKGTQLTLPVTTTGRLVDAAQFENIIVRARPDGSLVRVRDIGVAKLGSRSYDLVGRVDGKHTAFILVYARPQANALQVADAVKKRMHELAAAFPEGVKWDVPFDTTPFITASISEVVHTLLIAMLLVTMVVFIFLQNWRATLIPVLAVPVSVIGTFLGLAALGFSINVLTLFGLVLAIGIVVDDAIVVIENVERIIEQEHVSPADAADRAMKQVSGALIAIVLALAAVFVPVAFVSGITGALYRQFALTIVIAVSISGLVALTLTPALCSLLLRGETTRKRRVFRVFDKGFGKLTNRYVRAATSIVGHPRPAMAAFLVLLALTALLYRIVPRGFLPSEDKGYFAIAVQLPDGASLQRTEAVVTKIEAMLHREKSVRRVVAAVGLDILSFANQTNSAVIFVNLKPWEKRKGKQQSVAAILDRVNGALWGLDEAVAFGFNFPEIQGLGTTAGLELNLQDRESGDIGAFAKQVQAFSDDANKLPQMQTVQSLMRTDVPQVFVKVDEDAAQARGVGYAQIFSTLQAMLSTLYVNDFNLYGRTYRVQIEAQSQFRQRPEDIGRFHVRSVNAEMVPLSALVRTEIKSAPTLIRRFNGFTAALVTGVARPGTSSGEVLKAVEKLIDAKYAAQGVGFAYSGSSYQERNSKGGALVLVLGLVLVFLVLAALYESWSIPFAVLLGLPFGILGALFGVWLRHIPADVYFQIGIITVMGLAAKNAILIVAFANALHQQGTNVREAAIEAARVRFRPILMTSLAFILGVTPLVIASGASAASRRSIGTGVFAGMLTATTVGVFFIPLFFVLIRSLGKKRGADA